MYAIRSYYGGGVALLRILKDVQALELEGEQKFGRDLVIRALEAPLRQIAINAGLEGAIVADKVFNGEGSFGFNAATDEYCDMLEAGIIDPTKVTRNNFV